MPAASKRRRNRRHDRRVWPTTAALAMFVLIVFAGHASTQTPPTVQPPGDLKKLKKLSLDELQAIEVTSVSKHPEKLSGAPSSIQVITGDDIRITTEPTATSRARLPRTSKPMMPISSTDFASARDMT
jgi:hypothetical protein